MEIVTLTADNFDQEVKNSDKTVLVDFYADWCGPCKMQSPIVEKLAQDRDDVKVCKLNIDEQRDIAIEYGVMSIPTIMIVKNGEVTYKEAGLTQKRAGRAASLVCVFRLIYHGCRGCGLRGGFLFLQT